MGVQLGAIGAIADAGLGGAGGLAVFAVFVIVAEAVHLAAIGLAVASPARAEVVLGSVSGALERHSRTVMIGLGLVFGAWFLVKSLTAWRIV